MITYAFEQLKNELNIDILGPNDPHKRISILSFNIKQDDKYLHYKLVAILLNDLFGIQSRAGCACAGPYAHRLLGINKEKSKQIEIAVNEGIDSLKPGFVRVNFHYLMTHEEVSFIINAILFISRYGYLFLTQYKIDLKSGNWQHNYLVEYNDIVDSFGLDESMDENKKSKVHVDKVREYKKYLTEAKKIAENLQKDFQPIYQHFSNEKYEDLRFFNFILCS